MFFILIDVLFQDRRAPYETGTGYDADAGGNALDRGLWIILAL